MRNENIARFLENYYMQAVTINCKLILPGLTYIASRASALLKQNFEVLTT